ncbi:MAG: hypothetical protein ENTB_05049 [Enterocloster aldenensis]
MAKPGRLPDFRKMYPEASKEVIEVLKETERKMQYQEYDLKAEQTIIDQEVQQIRVIPSREDSYERLLEEHNLPADEQTDIETIVLSRMMRQQLHEAIRSLQEEERYLIIQLFYAERSERELAAELGLSQKAINKRRHKILEKLKKFLEKV